VLPRPSEGTKRFPKIQFKAIREHLVQHQGATGRISRGRPSDSINLSEGQAAGGRYWSRTRGCGILQVHHVSTSLAKTGMRVMGKNPEWFGRQMIAAMRAVYAGFCSRVRRTTHRVKLSVHVDDASPIGPIRIELTIVFTTCCIRSRSRQPSRRSRLVGICVLNPEQKPH